MTKYRAEATKVGRWWAVSVPDVPFAHSQGLTWEEAHDMIKDALSAIVGTPTSELDVEMVPVELPNGANGEEIVRAVAEAREAKAAAAATEAATVRTAAQRLVDAGLTVRDAGRILGLSYQRVSQLTRKKGARHTPRSAT